MKCNYSGFTLAPTFRGFVRGIPDLATSLDPADKAAGRSDKASSYVEMRYWFDNEQKRFTKQQICLLSGFKLRARPKAIPHCLKQIARLSIETQKKILDGKDVLTYACEHHPEIIPEILSIKNSANDATALMIFNRVATGTTDADKRLLNNFKDGMMKHLTTHPELLIVISQIPDRKIREAYLTAINDAGDNPLMIALQQSPEALPYLLHGIESTLDTFPRLKAKKTSPIIETILLQKNTSGLTALELAKNNPLVTTAPTNAFKAAEIAVQQTAPDFPVMGLQEARYNAINSIFSFFNDADLLSFLKPLYPEKVDVLFDLLLNNIYQRQLLVPFLINLTPEQKAALAVSKDSDGNNILMRAFIKLQHGDVLVHCKDNPALYLQRNKENKTVLAIALEQYIRSNSMVATPLYDALDAMIGLSDDVITKIINEQRLILTEKARKDDKLYSRLVALGWCQAKPVNVSAQEKTAADSATASNPGSAPAATQQTFSADTTTSAPVKTTPERLLIIELLTKNPTQDKITQLFKTQTDSGNLLMYIVQPHPALFSKACEKLNQLEPENKKAILVAKHEQENILTLAAKHTALDVMTLLVEYLNEKNLLKPLIQDKNNFQTAAGLGPILKCISNKTTEQKKEIFGGPPQNRLCMLGLAELHLEEFLQSLNQKQPPLIEPKNQYQHQHGDTFFHTTQTQRIDYAYQTLKTEFGGALEKYKASPRNDAAIQTLTKDLKKIYENKYISQSLDNSKYDAEFKQLGFLRKMWAKIVSFCCGLKETGLKETIEIQQDLLSDFNALRTKITKTIPEAVPTPAPPST